MNYPQRIKTLEGISKQNLQLYDKLQNVKSTINTKAILDKNQQQIQLRKRIKAFGPDGQRKKDPLIKKMQSKQLECGGIMLPATRVDTNLGFLGT